MPTAAPAGYVTPQQPDAIQPTSPFDATKAESFRGKLVEIILRQVLTAIFGFFSPTGGAAIGQLSSFFTDFLGIFGNPVGLGTGSVTLGSLSSIPFFGPMFSLFGGASNSSQAFSWLNPATSVAGLFAPLINGVTGGTTNPLSTLLSSLTGTASTTSTNSTNISSLVSNLFGGASILPQVQNSAVAGFTPGIPLLSDFTTLITNMFNGFSNSSSATTTQGQTYDAITGQTNTITGTAAALAQFIAAFGDGNKDSDDFERTSSTSLGANWSTFFSSGSGPLNTADGHNAHYGAIANTEFVTLKTNIASQGNHQTVSIVLNQAIPAYPFYTPFPYGGAVDIWLRCTNFASWGARTGVRFRVLACAGGTPFTTFYLDWVNAGTVTNLATGTMTSPAAGAVISLEAGVAGNARKFTATLNGSVVTGSDYDDTGPAVTTLTGLYRGMGGLNNGGMNSPDIKQWTAQG